MHGSAPRGWTCRGTRSKGLDEKTADRCRHRLGHGRDRHRGDAGRRGARRAREDGRRGDVRATRRHPGAAAGQEVLDERAGTEPVAGALDRTGDRADPARRHRPPVARPRRRQADCLPQGLHPSRRRRQHRGLGRQRPLLPRRGLPRADPDDPDVDGDHRRAGGAPGQRVRQQHVPEGDDRVQPASGPRRHQGADRTRRQRQRRRLHRGRQQDRDARRQCPRRQLLHVPGGADLHRGLLLSAVQRAGRPQRHDDRRVRLAAPHHGEPAGHAHRRSLHQPPGPPEPLRERLRTRVAAPRALLHRPVRDDVAQRGPVRLRTDADGLRQLDRDGVRPRRRQPSLLLPGVRHRPDAVQPQSAGLRRAGELAQPVARGRQPERDPGRLRQRVLVHVVPLRPLRHRHHLPAAQRRRSAGPREPGRRLEGRGRLRHVQGDPRLPIDGPARQDRRRLASARSSSASPSAG